MTVYQEESIKAFVERVKQQGELSTQDMLDIIDNVFVEHPKIEPHEIIQLVRECS